MVAVRFGDEGDFYKGGSCWRGISLTYKKPIIIVNGNESKYAQVSVGFRVAEVDPMMQTSISRLGRV